MLSKEERKALKKEDMGSPLSQRIFRKERPTLLMKSNRTMGEEMDSHEREERETEQIEFQAEMQQTRQHINQLISQAKQGKLTSFRGAS